MQEKINLIRCDQDALKMKECIKLNALETKLFTSVNNIHSVVHCHNI